MGSLTRMFSDQTSTLELFEQLGLQREHWNAIRRQENRALAEKLVACWREVTLKQRSLVGAERPHSTVTVMEVTATSMYELTDLELARKILGSKRVISAEDSSVAWGMKVKSQFPIRYSGTTLRECARENDSGETDWRLIFYNGLSLLQQREIQGVSALVGTKQPCFKKKDWWLEERYCSWTGSSPGANYILVDLEGRFAHKRPRRQDKLLVALGKKYKRCDEHVFAEIIQTIYMTQENERIASCWYHQGVFTDFKERRVMLGDFGNGGLDLRCGGWGSNMHPGVCVVVCRAFDN